MENHFPTLIWFLGAMQSAQNNEYLVCSTTYVLDFLLHQQRPHQKPTIFHCKSKKLTKSLEEKAHFDKKLGIIKRRSQKKCNNIINSFRFIFSRFNWSIIDESAITHYDFYRDWHAILFPMQFSESNVSQVLEVQPPNPGSFVLQCQSDQSGYYESKVNLTLKISDSGDNGSTVSFSYI